MKNLLAVMLVLFACSQETANSNQASQTEIKPATQQSEQQQCTGEWRTFSNGCADICSADKYRKCTMSLTDSCDCGENKCWDNETMQCIDNP
ncbi:MAG: hypothetical protein COV36_06565 [Alphaproteobacteria bacterium CG11_big_fil_rev_8_21_14_0_20_44_7]|nr:MAG: hypothetical protein COV36_06565 [Alphaproteobacteria bacterium CG11_big_fil_rev_8_21_14_0_20_44_7]